MEIINITPNESGSYPPIQSWGMDELPEGYAVWPDELDASNFYRYNGFVVLTVETVGGVDTVTKYEPNVEAWEAWKASLPPDPEPSGDPTYDEMAAAIREGVDGV